MRMRFLVFFLFKGSYVSFRDLEEAFCLEDEIPYDIKFVIFHHFLFSLVALRYGVPVTFVLHIHKCRGEATLSVQILVSIRKR